MLLAASDFQPGDTVRIRYLLQPTITAKVVEVEPNGRYGKQRGWLLVEQDHEEHPIRFEAWHGYCTVIEKGAP